MYVYIIYLSNKRPVLDFFQNRTSHISQKLKTTQMPINNKLEKNKLCATYKIEYLTVITIIYMEKNMNEPHNIERKKAKC